MEKVILKDINIIRLNTYISKIEKMSGYREKDILSNCYKITEEKNILTFYHINKESFFKYDVINNKIVG